MGGLSSSDEPRRTATRHWAFIGLVASSFAVAMPAKSEKAKPPALREGFRFEAVNDSSLGLWDGDKPVFVYNHGTIRKPGVEGTTERSTYIHPIYGLDGEVLTDDFPADHLYHRGLYWAWPHVQVGDKEYDLWILRGIRYEFQRWLNKETKRDSATLGVLNGWFVGEKQIMREEVRLRAHSSSLNSRSVDVSLKWTPTDRPVTLWGAEGKSYGGYTLRYGPRSQTIITAPSGRTTEDLLVTKMPWADLSGDFAGPGKLSGIAVFVHPRNPDYPPTWMTRHYGMLAVGWPGITPKSFPPGKSFTCRYRLWIHRGAPAAAEIQQAYDKYAKTGG